MTRVSIALPVYNGERYLEQALASLTAQTHTDLEILISDNGSTDRTAEICQKFAASDDRVKYFRQPENRGISYNTNFVLAQATAPYVRLFAYDDLLGPTCVELCARALDEDPDLVLAWPHTVIIDDDGQPIGEANADLPWDPSTPHSRVRSLLGRPIVTTLLLECNPQYGLIRRTALDRTRGLQNFTTADRVLLIELAIAGPWRRVPEAIFYNRKHQQSSVGDRPLADIAAYYDPRATAPVLMPVTRLLRGYVTAVLRTPGVRPIERTRLLREIVLWLVSNRRWRLVYHEFKVKIAHVTHIRRIGPHDPELGILRWGLWN